MDFLKTLATDCNFNLSLPIFFELRQLPEDQLRSIFAEVHARCQDDVEIENELWTQHPGYMNVIRSLQTYIPPLLLLIGTVGNSLSVFILAKSMFRVGTYSYLTMLSVIDLLVLYVGLFRMWMGIYWTDIQHHSNALCKLVNVLGYTLSDISVWLIVAVTVERFLAVNLPLRAQRMCSARRARWVIMSLVLGIFALNMHFFWTVEVNPVTKLCDAAPSHEFLVKHVWTWVDLTVYSMAPFLIILVLNSLIIRRIMAAKRKRTLLQLHPLVITNARSIKTKKLSPKPNEQGRSLTWMLLVISFGFVLTTLPMTAFTIVNALCGPGNGFESKEEEMLKYVRYCVTKTVVELLMYLSHSMNFLLYCAMGEKFRQQLRILVARCLCRKPTYFVSGAQNRFVTRSSSTKMTRMQSSKRSTFIDMRD